MSYFQVTTSQLNSIASELNELNSQLKTQINRLEETEQNLNAQWDGEANNAFHTSFQNDKGQMMNFCNAINNYVQNLIEMARKYDEAENRNTEIAKTRTF